MTFRSSGACTLHDTAAPDFGTEPLVGSVFGQKARPCGATAGGQGGDAPSNSGYQSGGGGDSRRGRIGGLAFDKAAQTWRLGRLRNLRFVEVLALVIFWAVVFFLRDAAGNAGDDSESEAIAGGGGGRNARHPDAWAELTKSHVV
jgi:hypothetical protein